MDFTKYDNLLINELEYNILDPPVIGQMGPTGPPGYDGVVTDIIGSTGPQGPTGITGPDPISVSFFIGRGNNGGITGGDPIYNWEVGLTGTYTHPSIDLTSGIFTVPYDGQYTMSVQVGLLDNSSQIYYYHNNIPFYYSGPNSNSLSQFSYSVLLTLNLTANDTVFISPQMFINTADTTFLYPTTWTCNKIS